MWSRARCTTSLAIPFARSALSRRFTLIRLQSSPRGLATHTCTGRSSVPTPMKPKLRIVVAISVYVIVASVLAMYIGGLIYTTLQKEWRVDPAWPRDVKLTTWWAYWKGYSYLPEQRKSLEVSIGLVLLLLAGTPLLIIHSLMSKQRSLHGDRKFARVSEVKKHGLLGDKGLIIGRLDRDYVVLPGNTPVM